MPIAPRSTESDRCLRVVVGAMVGVPVGRESSKEIAEEREGGHANCLSGEKQRVRSWASKEGPTASAGVPITRFLEKKEEGGLRRSHQ